MQVYTHFSVDDTKRASLNVPGCLWLDNNSDKLGILKKGRFRVESLKSSQQLQRQRPWWDQGHWHAAPVQLVSKSAYTSRTITWPDDLHLFKVHPISAIYHLQV